MVPATVLLRFVGLGSLVGRSSYLKFVGGTDFCDLSGKILEEYIDGLALRIRVLCVVV